MIDVKVEGTQELLKTLKRLHPSLAENGLRQGVTGVAREVVKATRTNLAPHKRTGNLAKSLGTSSRIDRRRPGVTAKARYRTTGKHDGFYGKFLEFGTKHITPIRPMTRAAQEVTPRAPAIIRNTLTKNMAKIVARARTRGVIR